MKSKGSLDDVDVMINVKLLRSQVSKLIINAVELGYKDSKLIEYNMREA